MSGGGGGAAGGDVVVVGGGVIGLASAWQLARQGAAVTVVDPEPGSGASSVAAGMLAPVTEARIGEEALLELGLASLDRWPAFAAELEAASGRSIGFRTEGTLVVAYDADDRAALVDLVDRQRSLGLDVDDLAARDLRQLEPTLAPAVRRGARAATERAVDPKAVVAALLVACERAGVTLLRRRVAQLPTGPDDRVRVALEGGDELAAPHVVLAAGAWSADLADVPVRPVKGQVLTLRPRPGDDLLRHVVRAFVRGSVVYLVPRDDGRVVCGATMEERGWDRVPTAGAAYELLRDVLLLVPGFDEAELLGTTVGFRPGTPDDLPRIGPSPDVEGLVLATGHHRNGILLTPLTADRVCAAVTGAGVDVGVAS
ncbi:MAG TPA: glycine oxidase ThiO [Acidimicrobiales bacterium]